MVIAIIALLIGILLPALGKARGMARQLKDATQLRGIVQGMQIWAQNDRDSYPLPSVLDREDATMVEAHPVSKDNTGNICSVLVYNGFVTPAMFVSPAEANDMIQADVDYEYSNPIAAAVPERALWDPGFGAVPGESSGTGLGGGRRWYGTRGYVSYAHTPPFGKRKAHWGTTFNATEAVIANRGPLYGGSVNGWTLAPGNQGEFSRTLRIHGGERTWEGCVAFNDGRVVFATRPDPEDVIWTFTGMTGDRTRADNIFANENDATGMLDPDNPPGRNGNIWLRPYRNVVVTGGTGGGEGTIRLTAFVD